MSMGAYDSAEHQRREEKASAVDADAGDDDRTEYEGSVEYDVGDADAEDLLAQFHEINAE